MKNRKGKKTQKQKTKENEPQRPVGQLQAYKIHMVGVLEERRGKKE